MKFANPIYLTEKVKQLVHDFINDYEYDSYDQLSHSDKCSFSALLIEAAGKNSEHEFLCESNHLDQTIDAFKKALLGSTADGLDFLHTLKENTILYFEGSMEAVFNQIFEEYEQDTRCWEEDVRKYGVMKANDLYRERTL